MRRQAARYEEWGKTGGANTNCPGTAQIRTAPLMNVSGVGGTQRVCLIYLNLMRDDRCLERDKLRRTTAEFLQTASAGEAILVAWTGCITILFRMDGGG